MKSYSFAILLLCLVVAKQSLSKHLQPNNFVDDTCRSMPYPDFCVSTLRSDPKSASAKGSMPLGVILVDHIDSKANATLTKIKTLISRAKDTKLKGAMLKCRLAYLAIVEAAVPSSRGALISWYPKYAEEYMNDSVNEVTWCDKGLEGLKNPLTSDNDFVRKAASIVVAIAKLME